MRPLKAGRVHCHFGRFCAWWGWNAGAARAFGDAIRADPQSGEAYFRLGEVLGRLKRWPDAVAALVEAVRLCPQDAEMQTNLVVAHWRAGHGSAAVDALRRLIDLRPAQAELHLLLGVLLRRLGRGQDALHSYRWALRLSSETLGHHCVMAEALLGSEWEKVVASYRSAERTGGVGIPPSESPRSRLHSRPEPLSRREPRAGQRPRRAPRRAS